MANFNTAAKAASSATTSSSNVTSDWTASGYASKNTDVVDYYNQYASIIKGDTGISNISDYLLFHWNTWGMAEGRGFAVGGAFTNSIVSSPTAFNMGVMGEAGPEAIMPLTNINGSLGVRAEMPSNDELIAEMRELRSEVVMLRAETRAIVGNTSKSAKLLDRAMPDGQSILVTTTA